LFICSYFTTIPDGWAGGQAGGLEETKLKLTQPSLVELDLGLSLAITTSNKYASPIYKRLGFPTTQSCPALSSVPPTCTTRTKDFQNV
jgi:hypothetical protein